MRVKHFEWVSEQLRLKTFCGSLAHSIFFDESQVIQDNSSPLIIRNKVNMKKVAFMVMASIAVYCFWSSSIYFSMMD